MRRKKRQGLVSPVVAETSGAILFVEGKDRKKLYRTDSEVLQVGDLLDQAGVGAALGRRDARTWMPGEPADTHLVDEGLGKRPADGRIPLPIISVWVYDHAFQRRRRVASGVLRRFAAAT